MGGQPGVRLSGKRIVQLVDLERWLTVWAIWELIDGGVDFDLSIDEGGGADRAPLWVSSDGAPCLRPGTLAASLAPHIGPEPSTVEEVVTAWGHDRWPMPVTAVIDIVGSELADSDVPTAPATPHPWQRSVMNRVLPGVACPAEVRSRLAPAFADLQAAWKAFRRAHQHVGAALFDGVAQGLRASRPIGACPVGGG